jgi:hypothetical protein
VPRASELGLGESAKSGATIVTDTNTSWSRSAVAPVICITETLGGADGLTERVRVEVPCPVRVVGLRDAVTAVVEVAESVTGLLKLF